MDMLRVIAANGGLNRDAWRREDVDPAEFTRRAGFNYVFRKKGGMTPGDLREFMQQEGYLQADMPDRPAEVDDNDAIDLFDRAFRGGEEIYAPDQQDQVARYREAQMAADEQAQAEWDAARQGDPDFDGGYRSQIDELAEQAVALGATDSDIVGAAFDADNEAAHVAALQQLIEDLGNEQADAGTGTGVEGEAGGDFPAQGQTYPEGNGFDAPRLLQEDQPDILGPPTA